MSQSKVVRSAVCLIPPEGFWPPIQAIRKDHDPAFERWMPHINLLYPFHPDSQFPEDERRLAEVLKKVPSFRLRFEFCDSFDHGKKSTVWLKPVCRPASALVQLQRILEETFPDCTELSSRGGFTPHLTIGKVSKGGVSKFVSKVNNSWKRVEFEVREIAMISRKDNSPFKIRHRIPLLGVTKNPLPSATPVPSPAPARLNLDEEEYPDLSARGPKKTPSANPTTTTRQPAKREAQVQERPKDCLSTLVLPPDASDRCVRAAKYVARKNNTGFYRVNDDQIKQECVQRVAEFLGPLPAITAQEQREQILRGLFNHCAQLRQVEPEVVIKKMQALGICVIAKDGTVQFPEGPLSLFSGKLKKELPKTWAELVDLDEQDYDENWLTTRCVLLVKNMGQGRPKTVDKLKNVLKATCKAVFVCDPVDIVETVKQS
eukprot:m.30580 g.30580  ORF g.30580 m.30580 type:complete len:431 (-) comp14595_c0_seq1:49-1341(-)